MLPRSSGKNGISSLELVCVRIKKNFHFAQDLP